MHKQSFDFVFYNMNGSLIDIYNPATIHSLYAKITDKKTGVYRKKYKFAKKKCFWGHAFVNWIHQNTNVKDKAEAERYAKFLLDNELLICAGQGDGDLKEAEFYYLGSKEKFSFGTASPFRKDDRSPGKKDGGKIRNIELNGLPEEYQKILLGMNGPDLEQFKEENEPEDTDWSKWPVPISSPRRIGTTSEDLPMSSTLPAPSSVKKDDTQTPSSPRDRRSMIEQVPIVAKNNEISNWNRNQHENSPKVSSGPTPNNNSVKLMPFNGPSTPPGSRRHSMMPAPSATPVSMAVPNVNRTAPLSPLSQPLNNQNGTGQPTPMPNAQMSPNQSTRASPHRMSLVIPGGVKLPVFNSPPNLPEHRKPLQANNIPAQNRVLPPQQHSASLQTNNRAAPAPFAGPNRGPSNNGIEVASSSSHGPSHFLDALSMTSPFSPITGETCIDMTPPKQDPVAANSRTYADGMFVVNDVARDVLGEGTFGVTYLAKEVETGRSCVVKQLKLGDNNDEKKLRLFEKEIELNKKLGGICRRIPELLYSQRTFFVQEFINGKSLDKLKGTFDPSQVVKMLSDIAEVIKICHNEGILHRDIKPGNIIAKKIGADEFSFYLIDFGIAKQLENQAFNSATLIGTPMYLAPEVSVLGATFASDIFSLGVTALHLLVDPKTVADPTLCYVLSKMIEYEPNRRFANCNQLQDACKLYLKWKSLPKYEALEYFAAEKPYLKIYKGDQVAVADTTKTPWVCICRGQVGCIDKERLTSTELAPNSQNGNSNTTA